MKVIIATPLYPPDIGGPASYVKELAKRFKKQRGITIVTYAHLPEKVEGVKIVSVSKRQPLPLRLFLYTIALFKAALKADVIYAQNGASVELPAGIVALITRRPLIMNMMDEVSRRRAEQSPLLRFVERFALRCAKKTVTDTPLSRPEILPFETRPENKFAEYEASWSVHIRALNEIFKHAKPKQY